jgi:hypothetical protein
MAWLALARAGNPHMEHTSTQNQAQIDSLIVIVIGDRALKKLTDRPIPPLH